MKLNEWLNDELNWNLWKNWMVNLIEIDEKIECIQLKNFSKIVRDILEGYYKFEQWEIKGDW